MLSSGSGFNATGCQKGCLRYNVDDGITYQYVGGSGTLSSWRAVFGSESYGQLVNLVGAVPANTNPFQVTFQVEELRGMRVKQDSGGTSIHIQERGIYSIVNGVQADKTSGGGGNHFLDMWIRKNGIDVPNSGVRNTVIQATEIKVLILNWVVELLVDDIITKWIAVSNAGVGLGLYSYTNTVGPRIPAGIFSIMKIQ
jgi:hypothetical protein